MELIEKKIETANVTIWKEDNICHFVFKPGSVETLETAVINFEACLPLLPNDNVNYLLVDLTHIQSMSKEARDFYAGENTAAYAKAVALIIKSPISTVIGNFFLGINKPAFPTKLFSNETEAIEWLQSHD